MMVASTGQRIEHFSAETIIDLMEKIVQSANDYRRDVQSLSVVAHQHEIEFFTAVVAFG